ncbi:response regulator transcription factor [Anaeromicropila populeti]|uniref:Stage 0 sporulation protein A homolog n=1 Tax=Anaeromicropila populeti TaxID=37658 RepID=A0A1I6LF59_9FIRM|nr:helix-turn-helix domain-containing protein [Anaeromicropila populeti]SFS02083.1 two-component system, response regulator YesN [Anaeromicropila populeti]
MINLLIIDDDTATVRAIKDSIAWSKIDINNVFTAFDVLHAKQIVKEEKIDIIISDIEMPQETGLDLLKWVREKKIECELLFLTCHESFSYAADAINYDVAAYLVKPFDIHTMELNLQKIVMKLKQKRNLKQNSCLLKQDFWKGALEGELLDNTHIQEELQRRNLDIQANKKYCFVYSRISNYEEDVERYGKGVFEFMVEQFHREVLEESKFNENVIKFQDRNTLNVVTICDEKLHQKLMEKCQQLMEVFNNYFQAFLTCCISNVYEIVELFNAKQKVEKYFNYNLRIYSCIFQEQEVELPVKKKMQMIELEKMIELVEIKDRTQILRYLKQVFNELEAGNNLNIQALYLIKQEILQVVYADLMKQGIQATKLFYDEISIKMSECATNSTVDMIRWVNYLLEKTFDYEYEVTKSVTVIDKINNYIHQHYSENIGRNDIAKKFYLSPEYLSKLYKKRTGVNLKEYINEYRIEKAKELLKAGEKNISNIAESVGFDNYSYFSTIFKKITGVSPKEYREND